MHGKDLDLIWDGLDSIIRKRYRLSKEDYLCFRLRDKILSK